MQQNHGFVSVPRTLRALTLLVAAQLSTLLPGSSSTAEAQTIVPVDSFRSVELHSGGRVVLRPGPTPRVTLIKGTLEYTNVSSENGGRLVIKSCPGGCPRGYKVEVEVVTPEIAGIVVENGGTLQLQGSFPVQAEVRVDVRNGGTIDIRQLAAERVTASVEQGGRIFTTPRSDLSAKVVQGGLIQYWGDARVEKSVTHGGVIVKGQADEADKPLEEIGSSLPPVPPVPTPPRIRGDR